VTDSTTELLPKLGDWPTLKDEEKEKEETVDFNTDETAPKNYPMGWYHSDTKQKDTDTEF
jgi:hypothetical protein